METICRSCVNYRQAFLPFDNGDPMYQWCEECMDQFQCTEGCYKYELRKEQENVPPVVL